MSTVPGVSRTAPFAFGATPTDSHRDRVPRARCSQSSPAAAHRGSCPAPGRAPGRRRRARHARPSAGIGHSSSRTGVRRARRSHAGSRARRARYGRCDNRSRRSHGRAFGAAPRACLDNVGSSPPSMDGNVCRGPDARLAISRHLGCHDVGHGVRRMAHAPQPGDPAAGRRGSGGGWSGTRDLDDSPGVPRRRGRDGNPGAAVERALLSLDHQSRRANRERRQRGRPRRGA